MTIKTLHDFATAMQGDESLTRGLSEAIDGKSDGEATKAFLAFASAHGFDITVQDLQAARQVAAGDGGLSDDQLDAVSGAGIFDMLFDPGTMFASAGKASLDIFGTAVKMYVKENAETVVAIGKNTFR